MPGNRMIRRHFHHGANQRNSRQRIIGGQFDDGVGTGERIANDRQYADDRSIARDHMDTARPKGTSASRQAGKGAWPLINPSFRSEEHTSELQSLMRTSYAVFCLKKKHTQI